jgi:hypothetical protein
MKIMRYAIWIPKIIWWALVIALTICLVLHITGCFQRIVEYDPTTGIWRYKSNSLATESHADKVTITTPSGIVVTVEKAYLDNDSLTFRFNPITRQIEAVTESGE